ncbi:MAG: DNA/RNA non-specific endonuclease [Gemmatirosa sp.]
MSIRSVRRVLPVRLPAVVLALGVLAAGCAPADRSLAPAVPDAPRLQVAPPGAQSVRISEIHYDNAGTDANEAIEVSFPTGTDLSAYTVVLYNGSNNAVYGTARSLAGLPVTTCGARGVVVLTYPVDGIQNGSPDGIALVNGTTLVEFLSYEGTMTGSGGPAAGVASTDIGVAEASTATAGTSLQRNANNQWTAGIPATFSACNAGETGDTAPPATVASITVSPTSAALVQNQTQQFTAAALDAQGQPVQGATITWSIADASPVATVSATGLVTAQQVGTALVIATSGTVSDTATVTVTAPPPTTGNVRISEIHYDDASTDAGEAIEVEGDAGTSLAGWTLVLYNGNGGASYGTLNLSGTLAASCDGRGVAFVAGPASGIQNGNPDGVALVAPGGTVVEFISYGGTFTATNGPANGMAAVDVGVRENGEPDGLSLQRARNGVWFGPVTQTFGACNAALPPAPEPEPTGIIVEGYSFRGNAPLPVGFQELYRVKDATTNAFIRSGITWTSSNDAIATVDALGNVTARAVGTAVITATETATGRADGTTVTTATFTYSDLSVYADELQFGTPTDATPSDDYLLNRETFAASWNATRGQPNWVAYNLEATHRLNVADRCDCFTPDPALPATFPVITTADYDGSGFSRGHMTMSADRTRGALDNATTFYYSNIIPQTNANNGGPWLELEQYLGGLAVNGNREIFVFSGGAAYSGSLNNANRVAIPTRTWKIAVIIDRNEGISSVGSPADVEIIAVDMPNTQTVPSGDWQTYRVSVDQIEALTGYDFLAALPDGIEQIVEARRTGVRQVSMDLQPGQLSVTGTSLVNVTLLSEATFDAATVNAADVRLIVNGGAAVAPAMRGTVVNTSVRDMNGDGRPDRVISFNMSALRAAGFSTTARELVLRPTGATPVWEAFDVTPPVVVP